MVIKLREVIIENVKNVEYGKINFVDKEKFLNVIGIYGQNGSGKTTLVDVLDITSKLIQNKSLSEGYAGMLSDNKNARVSIEIEEINKRIIRYVFVLKKVQSEGNTTLRVEKEAIVTKILEKYKAFRTLANYEYSSKDIVKFNFKEQIASKDALDIISDVSAENSSSFLFSSNFRKLISDKDKFILEIEKLDNSNNVC